MQAPAAVDSVATQAARETVGRVPGLSTPRPPHAGWLASRSAVRSAENYAAPSTADWKIGARRSTSSSFLMSVNGVRDSTLTTMDIPII